MITEGREKTYKDVARHCEAVPPKTPEPFSERKHRTKMIPQERHRKIAAVWMRKPVDKRENSKKIRTDTQGQVAQKETSSYSDQFGSPSKKMGKTGQYKGDPPRTEREPTRQRASKNRNDPKGVYIKNGREAGKRKYTRCRNTYLVKLKPPGLKPDAS